MYIKNKFTKLNITITREIGRRWWGTSILQPLKKTLTSLENENQNDKMMLLSPCILLLPVVSELLLVNAAPMQRRLHGSIRGPSPTTTTDPTTPPFMIDIPSYSPSPTSLNPNASRTQINSTVKKCILDFNDLMHNNVTNAKSALERELYAQVIKEDWSTVDQLLTCCICLTDPINARTMVIGETRVDFTSCAPCSLICIRASGNAATFCIEIVSANCFLRRGN